MPTHAVAQPAAPAFAVPRAQPFGSAEEAWFWTMASLMARRDGARTNGNVALFRRPCEPDDVVRCLDRLYRDGRIGNAQVRVLRDWGERGYAPDPSRAAEQEAARLWRAALERLSWPLRVKGIVHEDRKICLTRLARVA
jgi:hypothetical protein